MDLRPVGIFDSGLGGLTAVRELRRLLPAEDIVYFGDTARVPYGGRSVEELEGIAIDDTRFLLSHGVKAILVACGTVSSNCLGAVSRASRLPVTGVVVPAAREAVQATRSGRVGVLATMATARSGAFAREIAAMEPGIEVVTEGTGELVPLVESGRTSLGDGGVRAALERCLRPFAGGAVDTLILGCTHYPIISATIRSVMGSGVTLINSGLEAALGCREILRSENLLREAAEAPDYRYCVSDITEGFRQVTDLLLGQNLNGQVERVDIEKY